MLLTYKEVALLMRVSIRTVRQRVRDGTLTVKRFGPRLVRFPADQFSELLPVDEVQAESVRASTQATAHSMAKASARDIFG
jgi:excisionase family DNA binding protein